DQRAAEQVVVERAEEERQEERKESACEKHVEGIGVERVCDGYNIKRGDGMSSAGRCFSDMEAVMKKTCFGI
ncbi:MAG: hypothetical protein IKS28_04960, partial [Clostridia bacterium]|nr:hypothetical protein [Clostridia bacterium]